MTQSQRVPTYGAKRIMVLLAALAVAAAIVACGSDEGGEEAASVGGPAGEVQQTTFDGVESGELEVALEIDDRANGEEINMRVLGIFLGAGEDEMPQFDMAIEAHGPLEGEEIDFDSGIYVTPDRAVLNYEGHIYEPDDAQFEVLESSFEDSRGDGSEEDVFACEQALTEIDLSRLVDGITREGKSSTIDGTAVTVFSGDLNVPRAVDALIGVAEHPGCGAQLKMMGLPGAAELRSIGKDLGGALKEKRIQISLDKDHVLRNLTAALTRGARGGGERGKVEMDLVMRLDSVNEVKSLPFPTGAEPMSALSKRLGYNPLAPIEAGEAEGLAGLIEGIGGG